MTIYNFYKNGDLDRFYNTSTSSYDSARYGDLFTYEPSSIPLRAYSFISGSDFSNQYYKRFYSLKNIINRFSAIDLDFSFDNLVNKELCLLAFNTYYFGDGIEKGSAEFSIYLSGNLIARATDKRENGILYDLNDQKVGFILYKEGFVVFNNTASLSDVTASEFRYFRNENPSDQFITSSYLKWTLFTAQHNNYVYSPTYAVSDNTYLNTIFTYAEKYDLNHSNNPTYLEYGQQLYTTSSKQIKEDKKLIIKKTNKSPYISGSADFDNQTFITRMGLFDKDKKLIGIASLANPIRKTENREFAFKLKIDF